MSYRLINANALAMDYKEVNDMPCIYADLPNGLDGGYYDLAQAERTCRNISDDGFLCSVCSFGDFGSFMFKPNYCPNCGRRVVSE